MNQMSPERSGLKSSVLRKVKVKVNESEVAQSCPTLCNTMDYNLLGSSVHGILQARILEWVAISFLTQGSSPGPLHCRQMLYHLSHQGNLSYKL